MRTLRLLVLPGIVGLMLAIASCGGDETPTTPSPSPAPAPTPAPAPAPAPTTAGLQGTVASSGANAPLSGARVTVVDGPQAGLSVLTNANGSYRFDALSIANMNFSATASGYLEQRGGTFVNGTNVLNFSLALVPAPEPAPAPTPAPSAPTITIGTRLISGGVGSATQEWGFTASSSEMFTSYDWNFGDGGAATDATANEQHVYRSKGTFTVTVVGRRGSTSITGSVQITVS